MVIKEKKNRDHEIGEEEKKEVGLSPEWAGLK